VDDPWKDTALRAGLLAAGPQTPGDLEVGIAPALNATLSMTSNGDEPKLMRGLTITFTSDLARVSKEMTWLLKVLAFVEAAAVAVAFALAVMGVAGTIGTSVVCAGDFSRSLWASTGDGA